MLSRMYSPNILDVPCYMGTYKKPVLTLTYGLYWIPFDLEMVEAGG